MAKRKRLTPAQTPRPDSEMPAFETKAFSMRLSAQPPIAQVAGEAAVASALQELADEVKQAKDGGRMIVALPLDQVEAGYLVRDRMIADEDEMQVLMTSLANRGQQTPIEVVELAPSRYGLISGWRRLTALGRLAADTGEKRFKVIQALIRKPETAEDAYTAMVEENEIRVGLSYYERARIVAKSVEQGVFATDKKALLSLFRTASRAKRSKIKTFLTVYQGLDGALRFPSGMGERLGMRLAKRLEATPDSIQALRAVLETNNAASAEEEASLLTQALDQVTGVVHPAPVALDQEDAEAETAITTSGVDRSVSGIDVAFRARNVTLSGPRVTEVLRQKLIEWLRAQV